MKTEQSRQRKKSQRHIAQLIWGQVNHLNFYFAEIRINRFLSSYCFQLGSGIYFSLRSIQIFISVQRTIKIAFMLSNHSLFMACCVWVFCAHSINGIDHNFFYLNYFFFRCNYSLAAWSVFVHLPILSTQDIKFFFRVPLLVCQLIIINRFRCMGSGHQRGTFLHIYTFTHRVHKLCSMVLRDLVLHTRDDLLCHERFGDARARAITLYEFLNSVYICEHRSVAAYSHIYLRLSCSIFRSLFFMLTVNALSTDIVSYFAGRD